MNRLLDRDRLLACFLLLGLLFMAAGCGKRYTHPIESLSIYHTNDVHGYAAEERDEEGKLVRLGYPRLKTLVDENRTDNYKLLVDAGDSLHGQPLATARRGEFAAQLLQAMGYDALAVGNHEFDYGLPRLLELRDKYHLPFIAANVTYKDSGQPVFPPYTVLKLSDLRPGNQGYLLLGVVGVSSPQTPHSTSPANVAGLVFGDGEELLAQLREAVKTLNDDERVHVVVALTHLGTEPFIEHNAQWLAENVPGLDYIIDGHSHSEVRDMKVGETVITSTGAGLTHVGKTGYWQADVSYCYADLIPASELEKVKPAPKIALMLKNMEKELAKDMATVVGRTPFELEGRREIVRSGSSNLGRLITAAMVKYTGADAAIFNSGSIRAGIPAGDITRGKLLEALPFGNYAVTVKLTGSELRQVMAQGLRHGGSGGFLQFSGLTVEADKLVGKAAFNYKIRSIEINGQPLSEQRDYTVAINDFMNAGGDGYDRLKKPPQGEYETVEEMLLKYLRETLAAELSRVSQTENLISR